MKKLYEEPELYHEAFAFRNVDRETDFLQSVSSQYGTGGVNYLELACGDCPYAEALIQKGIRYTGLDISNAMLSFSRQRIAAMSAPMAGRLYCADMTDFDLGETFDLIFILMGSLHYLDDDCLHRHLGCISRHLKNGGLYVLEWCIDYLPRTSSSGSWRMDSKKGKIQVEHSMKLVDSLDQAFVEDITISMNDTPISKEKCKVFLRYPKEFALLLKHSAPQLSVMDHFNDWNLDKRIADLSPDVMNRPLCVVKKQAEQPHAADADEPRR